MTKKKFVWKDLSMIAAASKTKDYTASKSFDEDTILEDVDKEKNTEYDGAG